MPPKRDSQSSASLAEDLIVALSDKRVIDVMSGILEVKLQPLVSEMKTEMKSVQQNIVKVERRIDVLENDLRLDNLIFVGLLRDNAATAEESVTQFIKEVMKIDISVSDVSVAGWISRDADAVSRLRVRFISRKVRSSVMSARKCLGAFFRATGRHVYVNEDLIQATANLYREARQSVKQKKLHSCWTYGGILFIKKTSTDRPFKVSTVEDLSDSGVFL